MRKTFLIFICLLLSGLSAVSFAAEQRISQMNYRKVIILGEGIETKTAFDYSNSYRGVAWYKTGPALDESLQPGTAMKELMSELDGINSTGENWEFVVPAMGEKYFFLTLKNMKDGSLSNANGVLYLSESAGNESIESELARVSDGTFGIIYGK